MELLTILVLLAIIFYWLDAMRSKELAREAGLIACNKADVDFLDDTVALSKIRLHRNYHGRLVFYREYNFEFTSDSEHRSKGKVVMLGNTVKQTSMQPYRMK